MSNLAFEQFFLKTNSKWLLNLEEKINNIAISLGLSDLEINPNSRFGVVIFCRKGEKKFALKLVDMESEKGQNELTAVEKLKYSFMLKPTRLSYDGGYYLTERAVELLLPTCYDVNGRFNLVMPIFKSVIVEWITNPIGDDTYLHKYLSRVKSIKSYNVPEQMIAHINKAINLYKELFDGSECRLIHGDLHEKNMLLLGKNLIAIDPLGGYAPLEFEFTKYIENQLFLLNDKDEINKALDLLIDRFSMLGLDAQRLITALYIDSIERTSNSFLLDDSVEIINKGIDRINIIGERI